MLHKAPCGTPFRVPAASSAAGHAPGGGSREKSCRSLVCCRAGVCSRPVGAGGRGRGLRPRPARSAPTGLASHVA